MASIGSLCRAVLVRPAMTMSRASHLGQRASDRALRIAGPGLGMPLSASGTPCGPAACSRPRSAGAARRPTADGRPAARRVSSSSVAGDAQAGFHAAQLRSSSPARLRAEARPRIPVPCAAGSLVAAPPPRKSSAPYRRCRAAAQGAGWRKPSGGGGAAVRIRHFSSKRQFSDRFASIYAILSTMPGYCAVLFSPATFAVLLITINKA